MKKLLHIVRNPSLHWVGDGFPVETLFSYAGDAAAIDPFLLLDYAGPYPFEPGTAPRGVGEHPHRGFETVTIVYQGELAHRDSAGHRGTIGPGDVQWMTAAAGVVHEEFHSPAFTASGGTFEVAQLWVNLPAQYKMSPPQYQEIRAASIPEVALAEGASTARVIAGELDGVRGPARTVTPILLLDVRLAANEKVVLPIPDGYTAMAVLRHGLAKLGGRNVESRSLAMFGREGDGVQMEWVEDRRYLDLLPVDEDEHFTAPARLLVLAGEPIGEPVAGRGPFVMNDEAELQQAVIDYRSGRMGSL